MKLDWRIAMTATCLLSATAGAADYEPTWESLMTAPVPEWVMDAKFGVYTHWGPYSVPGYRKNTYVREIYTTPDRDKDGFRAFHEEHYGPIDQVGYKEIAAQFTAPKFDAGEWVDVMASGGVRFAGLCIVHHDGFCLWDSAFTRWDSMDVGAKRDFYGEIAAEIRKRKNIRLLATFHHARSYGFPQSVARKAGFTPEEQARLDIFDPDYADIYFNPEHVSKQQFGAEWQNKVSEVMRRYQPDIIWFDGLSSQINAGIIDEARLLRCFADYYTRGTPYADEVCIANKLPSGRTWNFPVGFGLRCYENGRDMERDVRGDWLIDRAIGYPWTWVRGKTYGRDASYHIVSIVDIAARGGIMLLSLTPKGDGSIPTREKEIMAGIGAWLRINGEGIYATRPWKVIGEGVDVDELRSEVPDPKRAGETKARWGFQKLEESRGEVFRFTRSKDHGVLYAHVIGVPGSGTVTIRTLARGQVDREGRGIETVSLLGSPADIRWEQTTAGLAIRFPAELPSEIAPCFRITTRSGRIDDTPRRMLDDPIERQGTWPVFKGSPLDR